MSPSVDVVIPTHGNWLLTARCLEELRRQTLSHRVIVVDDCSPDDTAANVRQRFPEVQLHALRENVGFARACNLGMMAGSGEIVVLMNSDVEARPDMLANLVVPFDDDRVGSATPLLLRPDGKVDAFGICADKTLACFPRFAGVSVSEVHEGGPILLGPHGATAAFRRAALDQVGLLDEEIFMYGEDLDLALRLRIAGWATCAVRDSVAVHVGGGSVGLGSCRQRQHAGFGRGYLLRSYEFRNVRALVRTLVTEVAVVMGDAVLSRDLAALRGRVAGWRRAREIRKPRRPVPNAGIALEIGFWRSIAWRIASR